METHGIIIIDASNSFRQLGNEKGKQ